MPRGSEHLLLVEDDDLVRRATARMVGHLGYRVTSAQHGEEALRLLADPQAHFDLLLTDVLMPGMNGLELHQRARQRHPNLRALYMSGYSFDLIAQHGGHEPGATLLRKPLTLAVLGETLREVFAAPRD